MNTALYYATALYELIQTNPGESRRYLKNLRAALARRGHEKLLPRIFAEYQKLDLGARRAAAHREITPQMERTDRLLQLYRRFISPQ